ncbi:MAG TPA: hypothetical protein PKD09_25155 [Aggregatilinea sp.]|jgi:cytochrome c5|uniref:hypothetical protein n=1 Tax=Aggregatilinea sp. TaxID=2806333 RepID=UPI002CB87636|nr:hypothetical protein [Aggregatilinea sp.]HML24967.1 hypothetical protein [Aggregatilinea sp.]
MKRLLSLVLLAALVISPVAVFAQTEEPAEWQQYTSDDGSLSLSYPAGWIAQSGGDDIPFPSAVIVDSEETLATWNDPMAEGPGAGQAAILTIILPADFFGAIGFELPEDIALGELTGLLASFFVTPDEATETPDMMATEEAMAEPMGTAEADMGFSIGEAEEMDLGGGVMGGYVEVSDRTGDGAYVVRDLGDELLSVTMVTVAAGEYTPEYADYVRQVAASVTYTGSADDLMEAMMGPSATAEAGEATMTGEELLQERCTVCHDLARVDSADKDEAGWTATVDRMIGYGAQLNAGERQAVIDYLVETH